MSKVIGVRFLNEGSIYHFSTNDETIKVNDYVLVNSNNTKEIVQVVDTNILSTEKKLSKIIRKATDKDLHKLASLIEKSENVLKDTVEIAKKLKLDMFIKTVKIDFDDTKITIYFKSDNRVDFRELIKNLVQIYHKRIELRQLYIKDEISKLGALSACGMECCCKRLGMGGKKASVKMAKIQNIPINMSKLEGMCGKVSCCLSYENDFYQSQNSKFPKEGSFIKWQGSQAQVIENDIFKETIHLRIDKENSQENIEITLQEFIKN